MKLTGAGLIEYLMYLESLSFGLVIGWIMFDRFRLSKNREIRYLQALIIILFIIMIYYRWTLGSVECMGKDININKNITITKGIDRNLGLLGSMGIGVSAGLKLTSRLPLPPLAKAGIIVGMGTVTGGFYTGFSEYTDKVQNYSEGIQDSLIENKILGVCLMLYGSLYLISILMSMYIMNNYVYKKEWVLKIINKLPEDYKKTKEFLKRRVEDKKKLDIIWYIMAIGSAIIGLMGALFVMADLHYNLDEYVKAYIEIKGLK